MYRKCRVEYMKCEGKLKGNVEHGSEIKTKSELKDIVRKTKETSRET